MSLVQVADLTADQFLILVEQIGKITKAMTPQGTGAEDQPAVPPDWEMIKQAQVATRAKGFKGYGGRSRR